MKTHALLACLIVYTWHAAAHAAMTDSFGDGSNAFAIDFVTIGNPGNPPDTNGAPNPAGAVDYVYRIGKFEVSRDMINKANAAGNLEITLADMTLYGDNGLQRPATGVSWSEAARFVNWLNAEQGFPPAYRFALQPGDKQYRTNVEILPWSSRHVGYDAANPFRNSRARYFLPSVDEWYKAAYYDPSANGGAGGYWDYPTGSDAAPAPAIGGTAPGTAVYEVPTNGGPADVNQAGGLSPYGVMGLGGNVWEYEETELDLVNDLLPSPSRRGIRGGGWWSWHTALRTASSRAGRDPLNDDDEIRAGREIGFRVASMAPEPSTGLLALLAWLAMAKRKPRRA